MPLPLEFAIDAKMIAAEDACSANKKIEMLSQRSIRQPVSLALYGLEAAGIELQ